MQANDNETAAKHMVKSIEILEDLVETFYFSNVNKKFKTLPHLLNIINRLCKIERFKNKNIFEIIKYLKFILKRLLLHKYGAHDA
jgi:hypothetical protein